MAKQPSPNLLLQRERMRHFLTQGELAEIIGVATKTIQRWEQGVSTPRAYYMRKLCEYFEKTPEALGFPDSAQEEENCWTGEQASEPASTSGRSLKRILFYLLVVGGATITIIVVWIILRPSW